MGGRAISMSLTSEVRCWASHRDKGQKRSIELAGGRFEFGVPVGQHSAGGLLAWSSERGLG